MFVFKVAKYVIKTILGLFIGLAISVGLIIGIINYFKNSPNPENNVTECIHAYNVIKNEPDNTWHMCPVCRKNFYKENGHNFCSPKCEKDYWELYDAAQTIKEHKKNLH